MKTSPWFIGIDLGTGSCKSIVVDQDAKVLGFGAGEYSGTEAQDRWQEQDPRDLLRAMIASVRSAVTEAGVQSQDCASLSIGGALHSVLAIGSPRRPLNRCHHVG